MTKTRLLLVCLVLCGSSLSSFTRRSWAEEKDSATNAENVSVDENVKSREEQLETAVSSFLGAKRQSLADLTLRLIEESKPTTSELQSTLDVAFRSLQDSNLQPGITHDHTFMVSGIELRASLYVPTSVKTPCALWVVPAHPVNKINSDRSFNFILDGLPKDTLVLWVHYYNVLHTQPDSPAAKKFSGNYDRQKVFNHANVFASAVAMALKKFPVDPDQVYCFGVSASGIATWWNAVCLPDVFAGVCCCDTRPTHLIPWIDTLHSTRIAILHGEKDDRCPVEEIRRANLKLEQLGFDKKYVEVAGGRHGVTWRSRARGLCQWVDEHVRKPHPKTVTFYPDQNGDRRFWLEALEVDVPPIAERPAFGPPPAVVKAEVRDDGSIEITTRGVTRLRIWLDTESATIRVNEKEVKDKPTKRIREALLHAKQRRDPKLFRVWAMDVQIAADAN